MIVYRICNEYEIKEIMKSKSFSNIGNNYTNDKKKNTHNYLQNKKYVHFFKDLSSIYYLNVTKGYYICTYDIPDVLLEENEGIGFYLDREFFKRLEEVCEYAITNDQILFNYLIKVEKINNYIDYEDYIYDNYKTSLEVTYEKIKKILFLF